MSDQGKTNVGTPCRAYTDMMQSWTLPDDLLGGTLKMRAARVKWLSIEPGESEVQYGLRLSRSVLYNCYSDTLDNLVGKPFSVAMTVSDVPKGMEVFLDNANGAGQNLHDFTKEVFKEAVHRGISHILVDYVKNDGGITLADEKEKGMRANFIHVSPRDLISWSYTSDGGSPVLSEIRIKESKTVKDGLWGEKVEEFVRVIHPTDWMLYKRVDEDYVLVDEGVMTLGRIPLITTYFNGNGFMTGTPCLEDLAWMNLTHWQSYSDQRNILRFARTGLLFVKGLADDDLNKKISVGPNQSFTTTNENADMKFVELGSGGSLTAGKEDIKDIEDKMDRLGMRPLSAKAGNDTATGKAIDENNENTDIHSWIRSQEVAITRAFQIAGEWMSIVLPEGFKANVYSEFALSLKSDTDLRSLDNARNRGDLSQKTYLGELSRRAVISDNIDIDKEIIATEAEKEKVYGFGEPTSYDGLPPQG